MKHDALVKKIAKQNKYEKIAVICLGIVLCFILTFILVGVNQSSKKLDAQQKQIISLDLSILRSSQCLSLIKPQDRTPENTKDCVELNKLPNGQNANLSTPTAQTTTPTQSQSSQSTQQPVTPTPTNDAPQESPKEPQKSMVQSILDNVQSGLKNIVGRGL